MITKTNTLHLEKYYTNADVRRRLKVSRQRVHAMAQSGKFGPCFLLGNTLFIPKAGVREYIKQRKAQLEELELKRKREENRNGPKVRQLTKKAETQVKAN